MKNSGLWKWDWLFVTAAAAFTILAYLGLVEMSGNGVIMDSDLQTYAQGMGAAAHPELFTADPALSHVSPGNSIPNLERMLASWLAPGDNWGLGLLRAGSLAIFLFFIAWYALGRWLYKSPALAALLAVCCGITVWIGWGTFWGVLHSDPVPRVFFAALLPLLLLLAIGAMGNGLLRPLAMFMAGLLIYVHGVSALNAGAMIFAAFALCKVPKQSFSGHIFTLLLCLILFFIPVLLFLWPSLFQGRQFSTEELGIFQQLLELRWRADFADMGKRLWQFVSPFNAVFPILLGGLVGWLVAVWSGTPREKYLCRLIPGGIVGLAFVVVFCWAEGRYAPELGRVPMGHELVRGLRLLIPLAWLVIVAGIGCITGPLLRRIALGVALTLSLCFAQDRQMVAAEYAFTTLTGVRLPLSGEGELERAKAANFRGVMQEVRELVPPGEPIFSPEGLMPIRFVAQRPLAWSFKDGYLHFYNKDVEGSRQWLKLQALSARGDWLQAWKESGTPWLLIPARLLPEIAKRQDVKVTADHNGYILARSI